MASFARSQGIVVFIIVSIIILFQARDFVPGFVKYPLYHCKQCAGRVLDEEQSQRR